MDNNSNEKKINSADFADFSIESILADFKAEERIDAAERAKTGTESRPIVMENEGQAIGQTGINSSAQESAAESSDVSGASAESAESVRDEGSGKSRPLAERSSYSSRKKRSEPVPADPDDTVVFERDGAEDTPPVWSRDIEAENESEGYAPSGDYASGEQPGEDDGNSAGAEEKILSPLRRLLAASSAKREEKRRAEMLREKEEAEDQRPEMRPGTASRLYMEQAEAMRFRCIFASFLCLVLIWLSYGLPAMGLLGESALVRTFVCLILELIVILIGLDIFSNGLVTLFTKDSGAESLIAASCIVSVLDAVFILATKNTADGLPFCAVSALSMTFALWGNYIECKSFAISFHVAAAAKSPYAVLSEDGGEELGRVLVKVHRPVTGFVRKSEEADIFENVFSLFAPLFIIFAFVLSLFCFFAGDKCGNFIHTFAAALTACASFSAVLGFSLPFYSLTKRLARSGVAIAGYAGCADLGRINQVVIKDRDIFPVRTLSIADISVSDGFLPDKVISYTASMVSAAGMGISSVFTELMKKNGYSMQKVEDFACHEGGGILARINGEQVCVGTSSFMKLMGVRVKKGAGSSTAVFVAINDTLAGIFEINYVPVASVQRGIVTLLRGKAEPVFAVRDFNITPLLVKHKFRLPKESYDFPSFADRYSISSPETEESGSIAAMFSRGGLNSVAGLVKRGKSLYNGLLLCAVLSILGAFIGMMFMLAMCWGGIYSSASCGNAITFMLLWVVPVIVISLGLRR